MQDFIDNIETDIIRTKREVADLRSQLATVTKERDTLARKYEKLKAYVQMLRFSKLI